MGLGGNWNIENHSGPLAPWWGGSRQVYWNPGTVAGGPQNTESGCLEVDRLLFSSLVLLSNVLRRLQGSRRREPVPTGTQPQLQPRTTTAVMPAPARRQVYSSIMINLTTTSARKPERLGDVIHSYFYDYYDDNSLEAGAGWETPVLYRFSHYDTTTPWKPAPVGRQ